MCSCLKNNLMNTSTSSTILVPVFQSNNNTLSSLAMRFQPLCIIRRKTQHFSSSPQWCSKHQVFTRFHDWCDEGENNIRKWLLGNYDGSVLTLREDLINGGGRKEGTEEWREGESGRRSTREGEVRENECVVVLVNKRKAKRREGQRWMKGTLGNKTEIQEI